MKHICSICVLMACMLTAKAQTEVDNFFVGPYVVDYNGKGDVKYRLLDNVDLYEFFELKKDTTIINAQQPAVPVKHAIQISGRVCTGPNSPKDYGLDAVWKQNIGKNLYFNGGLSFTFSHVTSGYSMPKRTMFEVGIPLQVELGKLNHEKGSLYGIVGVMPTVYSTLSASKWDRAAQKRVDDVKKSGFLIAPMLEFGGNIPVGKTIMRVGVYGTYKINCTVGDYDIYRKAAGRMFFGAKIGIVI